MRAYGSMEVLSLSRARAHPAVCASAGSASVLLGAGLAKKEATVIWWLMSKYIIGESGTENPAVRMRSASSGTKS